LNSNSHYYLQFLFEYLDYYLSLRILSDICPALIYQILVPSESSNEQSPALCWLLALTNYASTKLFEISSLFTISVLVPGHMLSSGCYWSSSIWSEVTV